MIQHIELNTGPDPKGSVIWMHGLGADCWDFVPIVRELNLEIPLRYIFPQAPVRPITLNNGMPMPGWYDIALDENAPDFSRRADEGGIRESQAYIDELIAREIARGVDSDKIVLAGFSQGGVIALQTGLRSKHELGGILALSTYLGMPGTLQAEKTLANARIPILMCHGTQDPVIPIDLAHSSRDTLATQGYEVEWHEFPMPHSVAMEEVEIIADWLPKRYRSRILLA